MNIHQDLYQQLRSNKRKTVGIIIGFFIIITAFSSIIGWMFASSDSDNGDPRQNMDEIMLWVIIGIVAYILIMINRSVNIVMAMNHATEVTKNYDTKYQTFRMDVQNLCIASGLPYSRFRLFIINDYAPNACSVGTLHKRNGRFYGSAGIGVTVGMLKMADEYELEGVLGHEIGHIIDQDTRLETIGIALTSLFAIIGSLCMRAAWYFSLFGGDDDDDDDDDDNNDSGVAVLIFLLVLGVIGWIFSGISYLTQLCLSRNREYLADAESVNLTRNPRPLIDMFKKLQNLEAQDVRNINMRHANANSNSLYMINPHVHESFVARMLDTHPPIEDRIKRLETMM